MDSSAIDSDSGSVASMVSWKLNTVAGNHLAPLPARSESVTSGNQQCSKPMEESAIDEFRRVTMMLSLLTVINLNNQGRRVTNESPEPMITSLERTQPIHRLAINAVAVLLVRKHEPVAVTVTLPDHDISLGSGSGTLAAASTLRLLVVQQADPILESGYAKADIISPTDIPNPEWPRSAQGLPPARKHNPDAKYIDFPPGKSSWEAVQKDPWSQVREPASLADHAATLQEYLADYQSIEREVMQDHGVEFLSPELKQIVAAKRIDAFDAFGRYILSTCSPKMRLRLNHPVSAKYYHLFSSITITELQSALSATDISITEPPRIRDLPLCDAILSSEVFDALVEYLRVQRSDLGSDFKFAALHRAFLQLDGFRNSREKDASKCPPLYTKATAVDFHYLFLTVLTGYKAGLRQFVDQQPSQGRSSEVYDPAWLFTFLLWRIAHSSILREHLSFLHKAGLLSRLADDADSGVGSLGMEIDGAEAEDAGEEAAETTNQEMSFMPPHAERTDSGCEQPDMGLVFLRWIRLLVCHISAHETLSLFFRRDVLGDTKVKIQVVALPPIFVEETPWKPVIQRALQSQAPFLYDRYDKIITILADCIKEGKGSTGGLAPFRHFAEEVMQVTGGVHCEAALACLVKFSADEGTQIQIDLNRHGGVATSRLCCPACWQLLALLDPPAARFGVRDHHRNVIPMQLPAWIPENHARAMVDIFRGKLCREISIMMERRSQVSPNSAQHIINNSTVASDEQGSSPPRQGHRSFNLKSLLMIPSFKLPMWNN